MTRLTQKQENFTRYILDGFTQRDAWKKAGYSCQYALEKIDSNACTLANSRKVQGRLAELRALVAKPTIANAQERREILTGIVRGNITDYQSSDGIYIDDNSPNTGSIESLETSNRYSRDSHAGSITIKRPVVPEAVRNSIFERDGNKCVLCASTDNLQLDHIVSLSKGGKTEENNLQTLCEECNKVKGAGKKSQPFTTTKLKLHNPMAAIAELNKMDHIYTETIEQSVTVQATIFILSDGRRLTAEQLKDAKVIEIGGEDAIQGHIEAEGIQQRKDEEVPSG